MGKLTDSEIEYKAQRWTVTLLSLVCAALVTFILHSRFKGAEENIFIISVAVMAFYVAIVANVKPLWKILLGLLVAVVPLSILFLVKNSAVLNILNLVFLFLGLFVAIEFVAELFSALFERLLKAFKKR